MKEIDKTYSQLAAVTEQLAKMAAEEDAAAALAELVIQELEQREGNILYNLEAPNCLTVRHFCSSPKLV